MGSKGSATTTSTSAPPQAVQDMYKYITEQGKTLQQQPYQQYQGQLVPDINATQQAGINQAQQYSESAQPYLQQAGQMTQQAAAGYNPQNFSQGVSAYMSPYMQQAMGATAAQLQNVNQQQQQQLLGQGISQGAFGGDRGKIAQAALMNQQNLAMGQTLGNMANQGYQSAAQNYMGGLAAQGQLGAQYGNIGNLAQTAGMTGAQQLSSAGAIPYAVQQAQNAAGYQQFAQQQAYPWQTLGSLANMASGLGAGQGGTSSTTSPGPNTMNSIMGLGTSLLGFMTPSDERLKENMEPIGKTFDGQNIYKFNYKGDPKTNIGLSAQEVEKRNPDAVHKTDEGIRMVDYNDATSHSADRGHFASGGSSMGGLVPESMERHPYAQGGYSLTPYADDPLSEEMAALAKITLGSYIPHISIQGGGGLGIPTARPYEEPAFDVSGISGFGKSLKGKYNQMVGISAHDPNYVAGAGGYEGVGPFTTPYQNGGLVPRVPHKDGNAADPDQTVPAESDWLGNIGSSVSKGLSALPSTSDQPGLIGNLFNKGQPLSDDARQAIMAAGFGMMASPSPFLAQAIGQGGLTGMNTYAKQKQINYETQKALAEQALKGREIGVQEQGNVYKGQEVQNAIITNRMTALQQLRMQKASYIENGQPVPENIQSGIDNLASSLATFGVSGAGGTPVSSIYAPAAVAGAAVAAPNPKEMLPITAPASSVSVTPAPAVSSSKPAEVPSAVAPEVKAESRVAVPEEPPKYGLPRINDPSFLTSLDPNNNPKTLRDRAALISGDDPKAAEKLREQATKAQDTMLEKGVGVGPNGELIKVPGWDQWKSMQENVKSNSEWFNKQASDALSRQNSRQQLASISKIVENFKPNAFAEQFANIQSSLDAIGIPVPDSAKVNAVAFQSFLKDTLRQIYSDVKQYSGGVKVAELAGLEKQAPSATLQPGTVENIMSQLQGSLNFADKHFYDALDFRDKNKGAFDQADFEGEFNKKNNLTKYTDDALKDIAVYGAAPTNKASFVPGKTYILDQGPNGEPVKPHKKRFIKFSAKGNPIFADVE